jgi:hypothetical protein
VCAEPPGNGISLMQVRLACIAQNSIVMTACALLHADSQARAGWPAAVFAFEQLPALHALVMLCDMSPGVTTLSRS